MATLSGGAGQNRCGKDGIPANEARGMLHPEQLKRVGDAYGSEIADLRAFFHSAGIETGSTNSLQHFAARVKNDRCFHRDLCSHVWILLHAYPGISYADLLGSVAFAAAGPAFAAAARDSDAHDLLRFLIEIRDILENNPVQPDDLPDRATLISFRRPTVSLGTMRQGHEDRQLVQQRRRTGILMLFALCLGVAVTATIWLRGRSPAGSTSAPTSQAAQIVAERKVETVPLPESAEPSGQDLHPQHPVSRRHEPTTGAAAAMARLTRPHGAEPILGEVTASTRPLQTTAALPPASIVPTAIANAPGSRPGVSSTLAGRGVGAPVTVPSAVLSQQIGARTLPLDYALEDRSFNARHPRLLRRRPLLPLAEEGNNNLESVASNDPSALFQSSRAVPDNDRSTTVRPVSLGPMAANVLYSPAPAYPPAAAAARVQGEVKVQAEVDRHGNVAFARVVSGPALLRDAAVDAVQRWRYRPYLAAGRPVAMSATAILEFQLQ